MFKRTVILALAGVVLLLSQSSHAISWGKIDATADTSIAYVERYGLQEIRLTVEYQPYYIGYMPAYVEVSIEGSPSWLTVIASPQTFVLQPRTPKQVTLIMQVKEHDIQAGQSGTVDVTVRGRIVAGGMFRTIDEAKLSIIVGYNPYTEIAISAVQPIERTSPDRELPFIINIYNYGNSRVIVDLTAEKEPGDWKYVISPSTVIIEPKQPGDETFPYATVTITLTSPHGTAISYHNDWEDFSIKARARSEAPYYEYQGGKWVRRTDEIPLITQYETTAYFLAKNKGFYVPGFDAIIMIAGLAIAGLLIARKKK
ncbi:MAG TPA: hypothetical protein ENL42_01180 [Thermoplasmatales archaeon]|nr:hypothetical protein [Thermoplasmatales archaeon]